MVMQAADSGEDSEELMAVVHDYCLHMIASDAAE
jgi:hypothetical protein